MERGGKRSMTKRTITSVELVQRLKKGEKPLILDVRRAEDKQADPTQVPGASWRDPSKVGEWIEELPGNAEVVLYCSYGRSISNAVVDALRARGLKACFIEGGLTAWKEEMERQGQP